ncbi:MAG: hypothetical protein K2L51_04600, partial [Clostridiales bacterium]|nr:hypothetical protein [Clostridiales bacterium]
MDSVFGIILKVQNETLGDTSQTVLLGKTMCEWVTLSLGEDTTAVAVEYDAGLEIPQMVKHYADATKKYTAVLFSDTPLITKKTVTDAVAVAENGNLNVVKMTRGYIFRTSFLLSCEKLYTENTHYFAEEDFLTASDPYNLSLVTDVMRNRILRYHASRGVRFADLGTTVVEGDVVIAPGVEVGPQNILKGKTTVKEGARLLYANVIEDGIICEGAEINSSRIYRSYIGERTTVGPYAYIRPDSIIGPDCRIGDFVEIKKSIIGAKSKVSHLSYVGDCEMGEACNIGCGVVFVNYDGKNKFKSKVGNRV